MGEEFLVTGAKIVETALPVQCVQKPAFGALPWWAKRTGALAGQGGRFAAPGVLLGRRIREVCQRSIHEIAELWLQRQCGLVLLDRFPAEFQLTEHGTRFLRGGLR